MFETWWLQLATHAKVHRDAELAELVDKLKGLVSIDLLNLEGDTSILDGRQQVDLAANVPIASESLSLKCVSDSDPKLLGHQISEEASINKDPLCSQIGSNNSGSTTIEPAVSETNDDTDIYPEPPPGPPSQDGRKRPRIVLKQSGAKGSSLKLRLKSKKLKPATLQKSESKGPYNTRGVKLTGSFLQRSGAEQDEGSGSSADEEYGEDDEMDQFDEEAEEEEIPPKLNDRMSQQRPQTFGNVTTALKRRPPAAPKSASSRQNIMKALGMRR